MNAAILFLLSLCSVWSQPISRASRDHNHGAVVFKTQASVEKKVDYSNFENEDDEENQSSDSKYILLTKCFFALAFSATLISRLYYLNGLLPLSRNINNTSSPKYILQRVLRL